MTVWCMWSRVYVWAVYFRAWVCGHPSTRRRMTATKHVSKRRVRIDSYLDRQSASPSHLQAPPMKAGTVSRATNLVRSLAEARTHTYLRVSSARKGRNMLKMEGKMRGAFMISALHTVRRRGGVTRTVRWRRHH